MPTSICRSIVTICSGLYLLIGMTRFSSKWILSHSTWYKFRGSRQSPDRLTCSSTFLSKISPSVVLVYSTYHSNKGGGSGIAVDSTPNAYVTGIEGVTKFDP